jgi:hypothetical protein
VTYLGGHGLALEAGKSYTAVFDRSDDFVVRTTAGLDVARIASSEITELAVSGPGAYRSGMSWMGGGFGLEGAVRGAVMAQVLTAVTSRRRVSTLVRVGTRSCVAVFEHGTSEPAQLALKLSRQIQEADRRLQNATTVPPQPEGPDLVGSLAKLAELHAAGALSDDEFAAAKQRLLS